MTRTMSRYDPPGGKKSRRKSPRILNPKVRLQPTLHRVAALALTLLELVALNEQCKSLSSYVLARTWRPRSSIDWRSYCLLGLKFFYNCGLLWALPSLPHLCFFESTSISTMSFPAAKAHLFSDTKTMEALG